MDKLHHVKILIANVFVTCKYDDTGVTDDLLDLVYRAAIEIGMTPEDITEIVGEE